MDMARLVMKATVAVALLAIAMQYIGLKPSLTSLFPRLGGRPPQTINAHKLLADLNSDILLQAEAADVSRAGASNSHEGESRDARLARAASAALSVMYLASLPGLQEQVRQTSGIVESLVRRVLVLDLEQAHRDLIAARHHQGQGQAQAQVDLMSAALLAVARLAAGDQLLQDWLLGAADRATAGGGRGGGMRLPEGGLLARLDEVLHSGVPTWQAAASVLLHTLATPTAPSPGPAPAPGVSAAGDVRERGWGKPQHALHPLVESWLAERAVSLVAVGKSLVEAGAHFNNSDAVLSGAQLLHLVASKPVGWKEVIDSRAHSLLGQVVVSYAGSNNSSSLIVGAAARLLQYLTGESAPAGDKGAAEAAAGSASVERRQRGELVSNLTAMGLVAPLVLEVRLGHPASLGPALELLAALVRGGGSDGLQVAREAVGAGALSLCAQVLFKVVPLQAARSGSSPDTQAHSACCYLLRHTAANHKSQEGGAGGGARGGVAGGGHDDASTGGGGEGSSSSNSSPKAATEAEAATDDDEGPVEGGEENAAVCERTEAGRVAVAATLLRIMRETHLADLHSSVLEACRDVAPSRPAALALAAAGAIRHLAVLLSHNTTKAREEGAAGSAGAAWVLHSQRSAAALLALLALQGDLREQLVAEGALVGLAAALRSAGGSGASGGPSAGSGTVGLTAQLRLTAAAALVPLLGDDARYHQLAVVAGVLEPLLDMAASGRAQEEQVALRVMRLLAAGPAGESLAELFRSLGVEL